MLRKSVIEGIRDLIERIKRGEVESAVIRVEHMDGVLEDLTLEFGTDEQRDAALAKLLRILGQLH